MRCIFNIDIELTGRRMEYNYLDDFETMIPDIGGNEEGFHNYYVKIDKVYMVEKHVDSIQMIIDPADTALVSFSKLMKWCNDTQDTINKFMDERCIRCDINHIEIK